MAVTLSEFFVIIFNCLIKDFIPIWTVICTFQYHSLNAQTVWLSLCWFDTLRIKGKSIDHDCPTLSSVEPSLYGYNFFGRIVGKGFGIFFFFFLSSFAEFHYYGGMSYQIWQLDR